MAVLRRGFYLWREPSLVVEVEPRAVPSVELATRSAVVVIIQAVTLCPLPMQRRERVAEPRSCRLTIRMRAALDPFQHDKSRAIATCLFRNINLGHAHHSRLR